MKALGLNRDSDLAGKALLVSSWLLIFVPSLLQKLLAPNRQSIVGEDVVPVPAADAARWVILVALLVCFFGACIVNLDRARGRLDGAVLLLLVPWVVFLVEEVARSGEVNILAFMYPLYVVGFAIVRPSMRILSVAAALGVVTAVVSMLLGIFVPDVGLYGNYVGEVAYVDKGLLSNALLSGVFGSANNLGQFLALCAPGILFWRRGPYRLAGFLVIFGSVVWSGSRSSLVVLAFVALVWAASTLIKTSTEFKRAAVRVVLTILIVVSIAVPFLYRGDYDAFSGRGKIWTLSIEQWGFHPFLGLGVDWYRQVAQLNSVFGDNADTYLFHGHNQFLHFLVTGGLALGLCYLLIMVLMISRASMTGSAVAFLIVGAFLISGTLELNLGFLDRYQVYFSALVPLLLVAYSGHGASTHSLQVEGIVRSDGEKFEPVSSIRNAR